MQTDADRLAYWPVSVLLLFWRRGEPPHIHVERDELIAKLWLEPVRLARSGSFGAPELREIERMTTDNAAQLLEAWNEYFGA